MANRIIRCTGASFGGTTIDGVIGVEFEESVIQRMGRSDGELGDTSADTIGRGFRGALLVNDEDVDITLGAGTTGVLVATLIIEGGTEYEMTVGLSADGSGVVFTGFDVSYESDSEQPIGTRCTFEGVFGASNTKTYGSASDVAAGTALVSLEAA